MLGSPDSLQELRRSACFRVRSGRGFTLIELLTVIAIIAILAAITFGIVDGARENAARSRAQAELSVLSFALEAYKRQYGDYPQTGRSGVEPANDATAATAQGQLFNALLGKLGPTMNEISGKVFVDAGRFSLQNDNLPTSPSGVVANGFIDPWGRLYSYHYRATSTGSWANPSYVLYSVGADGDDTTPDASGKVAYDESNNLDNIYANR